MHSKAEKSKKQESLTGCMAGVRLFFDGKMDEKRIMR